MNKVIISLVAILILTGCDNPRSGRSRMTSSQSNAYEYNSPNNDGFSFTNDSKTDSNSGTNSGSSNTGANSIVPADATHCRFSEDGLNNFESTSSHLGAYTLCQSSTDKTVFYVQIKTPPVSSSGDASVCFIPHTNSGNYSIFVGNPMCSTFSNPKEVKKISFIKYNEYSNALINSVMFFKDEKNYYQTYGGYYKTLDAYSICMNKLSQGNPTFCENFKKVNAYVNKKF